jgi:hypothetical protein
MIREKAPTILTAEGARRLTARIRDALALADDLLAQAYQGRAWEALGYVDWSAYCEGELPELRHIKLRAAARQARTKALHDEGATEREIAAATGASPATAHRDVLVVTGRSASNEAADEAPLVLTADVIEEATNWQAVLRQVRRAGDAGLTSAEFLEVVPPRPAGDDRTPWHHGSATAAFHSAERKGFVTRLNGVFRKGHAVYVTTTP